MEIRGSRNEAALHSVAGSTSRHRAIRRYLETEAGQDTADRIETIIRSKFASLADFPDTGHRRQALTSADVRFFSVYSYLIVYRPETKPLQVVSDLHANRDVSKILRKRS